MGNLKKITDLKKGDVFLDSFGIKLTFHFVEPIKSEVPKEVSCEWVMVYFTTPIGNQMRMKYRAERMVKVI